jgi:vacuolar-type H+-ATPase subunit I/STV1
MVEIDGDQFCENDYGLVVDNSTGTQKLNQNLDMLVQAGLQNQMFGFSKAMHLYRSVSMSQKIRIMEDAEQQQQQQAQQQQQQTMQMQQQALEAQQAQQQAEMELKDKMNQRDNDSRVLASRLEAEGYIQSAAIKYQADADKDGVITPQTEDQRLKLQESIREFDRRLSLDERKQKELERSNRRNEELQKQAINARKNSGSSK